MKMSVLFSIKVTFVYTKQLQSAKQYNHTIIKSMSLIKKYRFQFFKYAVYTALFFNVIFFFQEEMAASAHRFAEGFTLFEFIEAFTSTIDTAAWVVLLLLFELETYIIEDDKLKGGLLWFFHIIRAFCYCFVVYSFWGYLNNYLWVLEFEPIANLSLCEFVDQSLMITVDEFVQISAENCAEFSETELFQHTDKNIYTTLEHHQATTKLALVDILNSAVWILVVIVLEVDVWLQLNNRFEGRVVTISKYIKNVLYAMLLLAAIYWGISGEFLDFWDAFLWIIAFVFIEMNLFEWREKE